VGSPITLSGFNNIDFGSIVTALMQQASAPLTTLQNSPVALQTRVSTFSTLATQIAGLQTAAAALADPVSTSAFSGSSSDPTALGVSTSSTARAGHYDVIVNEVARAQVTVSTSTAPDASTTVVASGGTLTIGGVDVTLSGSTTLQGLADAINETTGIGVTATVLHTADNAYRLALTSTDTGAAHAFTVTNALTGGTGVTFGGNAVTATDASLLVNNVTVTSSSNTITDVVPGLTLTALKKDPTATLSVDVVPDSAGLKTRVQSFITAYNSLIKFTSDQRTAAGNGDTGSIGRDPMLSQLRSSLRTELLGAHGAGTVSKLAEIGVEFTQTGTLQLNSTIFDAAVTSNGADVQAVFAGTSGAFPAIKTLLDQYSPSTGYISTATDQLNAQIQRTTTQILNMQDRLAAQKIALQQEFAAADAAIKSLNNQSGALSNFSSSLGRSL
jgi:flagellar hook-associated protein 2